MYCKSTKVLLAFVTESAARDGGAPSLSPGWPVRTEFSCDGVEPLDVAGAASCSALVF